MKNTRKKGFTIVELVIVIAVIAILAAVLIPTFSNIIKKSNLSADMQAVREMNTVLATDESVNGKPTTMKQVAQILANAGYNSENWICLTTGYKVMWYAPNNRLVLVNTNNNEIEYPTEFDASLFHSATAKFEDFNASQSAALALDFTLSSSKATSATKITSSTSAADVKANFSSSISDEGASAIISAVSSIEQSNSPVKSALGLSSSNVYVNAAKEIKTSAVGNTSIITLMSVDENPTINSTGDPIPNVAYISSAKGDAANGNTASQENAVALYSTITQINSNELPTSISIILEPGMELDFSSITDDDFSFPERFSGYFGTTDASKPVIINKAEITSFTKYVETVRFDGSSSKYFLSGIFGAVYGETTIENVIFRNLTIDSPATDYEVTAADIAGKLTSSRNTCGIIGGVVDNRQDSVLTPAQASDLGLTGAAGTTLTKNGDKYYNCKGTWWRVDNAGEVPNVTIKNVVVEDTCTIISAGCVGGLVGYIGSSSTNGNDFYKVITSETNVVTIDHCTVSAKVSTKDTLGSVGGYGTAGGIVGFMCRSTNWVCTIKDSTFNGSINGYGGVSGICGDNQAGKVVLSGTNSVSGAQFNANNTAKMVCAISTSTAGKTFVNNGTLKYKSGMTVVNVDANLSPKGTLTAE